MPSDLCLVLFLVVFVTADIPPPVVDNQKTHDDLASQIQTITANLSALWREVKHMTKDCGVHIHMHNGDSNHQEDHDEDDNHNHDSDDNHNHDSDDNHNHDSDDNHNHDSDDNHNHDSDDGHHHDVHLYMNLIQKTVPLRSKGETHAHCEMMPNKVLGKSVVAKHKVMGSVYISQQGSAVVFDVQLHGFDKSLNKSQRRLGMHIHEFGDMERCCNSLGGHFNPEGKDHGGPDADHRHHGDLGNIEYDDEGKVNVILKDETIKLKGKASIIGRSIVIHEHADDFGKGGSAASKSSGDAGARIACCVIGRAKKREMLQSSTKLSSSTTIGSTIIGSTTTGSKQAGNMKTTSTTVMTKKP